MKRTLACLVLAVALAAPAQGAAKKITWGSIKAWVKKQLKPFVEQIKSPEVKAAIEDLRTHLKGLKGKLEGRFPQYRAILGYLTVAAVKAGEGAKAEDLKPLIEKIKESTSKVGKESFQIVRDWLQANKAKFKGPAKVFKTAFQKGLKDFKANVLSWWKKWKKKMEAKLKAAEGGAKKEEAPKKE